MPEIVQEIGAYAGLASIVGLAVLSALYFSQARDVKRLREWAGRAPERSEQQPVPGRVTAQPQTPAARPGAKAGPPPLPGGARPGARPGAPPVPGSSPFPGPPLPGGQGSPVPVPAGAAKAAAAAAGAGPATAAAQGGQATAAQKRDAPEKTAAGAPAEANNGQAKLADEADRSAAPVAEPEAAAADDEAGAPAEGAQAVASTEAGAETKAPPRSGGPATPAGQRPVPGPAGAPPLPGRPGSGAPLPPRPSPPVRRLPPRPGAQHTEVLPPSREGGPGFNLRLVALVLAGIIVVGGAVALGINQFAGDENPEGSARSGQSADSQPAASDGSDEEQPAARPVKPASVRVSVLNGTTVTGLASDYMDRLTKDGFSAGITADNPDQALAESVVQYIPGKQREARAVGSRLGITQREPLASPAEAAGGAAVVVIIGADKAPQ